VAGIGWPLVFTTTPPKVIAFALGTLALGVAGYFALAKVAAKWPFATDSAENGQGERALSLASKSPCPHGRTCSTDNKPGVLAFLPTELGL
jgi:hypothetical protein